VRLHVRVRLVRGDIIARYTHTHTHTHTHTTQEKILRHLHCSKEQMMFASNLMAAAWVLVLIIGTGECAREREREREREKR
jgi:hypothetical protein